MRKKNVAIIIAIVGVAVLVTMARDPMKTAINNSSPISGNSANTQPKQSPVYTVGELTWRAKQYLNQSVRVRGYLLKKEVGYNIFSDEKSGSMTAHDLSVTGAGISTMQLEHAYTLGGVFVVNSSLNSTLYALKISEISSQ